MDSEDEDQVRQAMDSEDEDHVRRRASDSEEGSESDEAGLATPLALAVKQLGSPYDDEIE